MKQIVLTVAFALVAAIATGVALGSGPGSADTQETAAGVAVFAGLMAIATPLLGLGRSNSEH